MSHGIDCRSLGNSPAGHAGKDRPQQGDLAALAENKAHKVLPMGYEWVTVVLPEQKAFVVRKWSEEAKKKIEALS